MTEDGGHKPREEAHDTSSATSGPTAVGTLHWHPRAVFQWRSVGLRWVGAMTVRREGEERLLMASEARERLLRMGSGWGWRLVPRVSALCEERERGYTPSKSEKE